MSFTMNNNLLATSSSSEVGSITAFMVPTAPTGYLSLDGTTYNTADYPELAAHLGESGATFTLPDYRGAFLRGTGTHGTYQMADGNYFAGPALGSYELDQFQGHFHDALGTWQSNNSGGYYNLSNDAGGGTGWVKDARTDGTNGTPRKGDETRPFNYGVHWCIRYAPKTALNATATSTGSISATGDVNENAGIDTYFCEGGSSDITVTLPSPAGLTGREFTFIKTDTSAGNVIIEDNGTELINGYASITLDCQYARIKVVSTGSTWMVKEHFFTDKEYSLTATATNWTTSTAKGMPHRGLDGVWYIDLNVLGALSSGSTNTDVFITGLAASQYHANAMPLAAYHSGSVGARAAVLTDDRIRVSGSASGNTLAFAGTLRLDAKPTFVA